MRMFQNGKWGKPRVTQHAMQRRGSIVTYAVVQSDSSHRFCNNANISFCQSSHRGLCQFVCSVVYSVCEYRDYLFQFVQLFPFNF